jgi:predicted dehydrogenase
LKPSDPCLPDYVFGSLKEAIAQRPQAVIVANPTALHLETARVAMDGGAHVFIEKPISHTLTGCEELLREGDLKRLVIAVGCNLRFHPLLLKLREVISDGCLGRPILARAHFGSWLPDWHPWEDYRVGYAARKELGGGSLLTHIHEIDYLTWLFGKAIDVVGLCFTGKVLETDVDEAAVGLIRHASGTLSNVSLSLCQKPPTRTLQVAFERGRAEMDWMKGALEVYSQEGAMKTHHTAEGFSWEETYLKQGEAFETVVRGGTSCELCMGEEAVEDLSVVLRMRGEREP